LPQPLFVNWLLFAIKFALLIVGLLLEIFNQFINPNLSAKIIFNEFQKKVLFLEEVVSKKKLFFFTKNEMIDNLNFDPTSFC